MRLGYREGKGDRNEVESGNAAVCDGRRAKDVRLGYYARKERFEIDERAGYDRIRHIGGRARRYRDSCNRSFQAPPAGALGCDCGRDKQSLRECGSAQTGLGLRALLDVGRSRNGQSTVEFAIVMAAFLSLVAALSVMWHLYDSGMIVDHVLAVASHHVQAVALVTVSDIFLY